MSERLRHGHGGRPLIALVCAVPLLGEAIASALDFAEARTFPESGGDVGNLLRWLHPDAVVVDSDSGATAAARYADEHPLPVLQLSVPEQTLRLLRDGTWEDVGGGEAPGPEMVRNVLAGALFAGGIA